MEEPTREQDAAWPAGWEGHERAQRLYSARLPLADKLRWLEEAQDLVEHLKGRWKQFPGQTAAGETTGEQS